MLARAVGAPESEAIGTFGVIFTSIVVEALPFILIGAIASAALAAFVPDGAFARLGGLPTPVQVPAAALAGLAMPVCECGSVPVGRRLILRGVHPSAGIAFMLAAPILNPIVLASTWVAYGAAGRAAEMTIARAALGLTVAVAAGLLIGRGREPLVRTGGTAPDEHDHGHDHGSGGAFAEHLAADFLFTGKNAKQIGFLQLNAAGRDDDLTRQLGLAAGKPVELEGFVSQEGRPFTLSRFYISCCVADAVPIGVHVMPGHGATLKRDDWVDVTGVLSRGHREWVVRALAIRHIKPPSDPYLSFTG